MSNWKKATWITGIGAVSITGIIFLRGLLNKAFDIAELKKMSDQLQTIPSAMIHKLDFTGLSIRIDVKMKNPSNHGFKMTYPFIKVNYNKKPIGSSQAIDKVISIPPNGEVNILGIMLNFPLFGMFSIVSGLIKSLQSGEAVKLEVNTASTIDPLWTVDTKTKEWKSIKDFGIKKLRAIPYDDNQEVTLKKGQI